MNKDIILSGFVKIDAIIGGFGQGELIFIGAGPSLGKTSFALSVANKTAIKDKIDTCFVSLELSVESLIKRIVRGNSTFSSEKFRQEKINNFEVNLFGKNLYILDKPNVSVMELETTIRELVDKRKIKIVFIDYLNLVSTDKSTKPRTEQIVDISKSLKTLSMELSIPIIGLIQLGRNAESQIPDITDVGEMEKYADIILLLNKEDAISNEVAKQNYKVIIAKNREKGKLDKIDIHFIPDKVRFEN